MSIHYSLSIAILLSFLRLNFRVELSRQTENFLHTLLLPRVLPLQLHVSLPISPPFPPSSPKVTFPLLEKQSLFFQSLGFFYIPIDKIGYIKSSAVENYRYEIIDKNTRNENVNCSVVERKKKKRKRVSSDSRQRVITSSIITLMQLTRMLNAFFCIIHPLLITLIIFARV